MASSTVDLENLSPDELSAVEHNLTRRRGQKVTIGGQPSRDLPKTSHMIHRAETGDTRVSDLMAMGQEELLMREAEVNKKIVVKGNNRDRVGLTTVELSHLHQQLQGITTTCTLIIGFAMAALSTDLLSAIGDDSGSFCIYKSWASAFLGGLFIILTTTCVCACFTVIACVQIIIFQSQRAIFSRKMFHKQAAARADPSRSDLTRAHYSSASHQPSEGRLTNQRHLQSGHHLHKKVNLTSRIVQMTQLLMYGGDDGDDDDAADVGWWQAVRALRFGSFTIYRGLAVALSCFFLSTVILVWLFIGPLARWKQLDAPPNAGLVDVPAAGGASVQAPNPDILQSVGGQWKGRCLNPYNDDDETLMIAIGSTISGLNTLIFLACIVYGFKLSRQMMSKYKTEALLALPEDEDEDEDSGATAQNYEWHHDSFRQSFRHPSSRPERQVQNDSAELQA